MSFLAWAWQLSGDQRFLIASMIVVNKFVRAIKLFLQFVEFINEELRDTGYRSCVLLFCWLPLVIHLDDFFRPNISAILPVKAKYPTAPTNSPKAIRLGTIPPIICASPKPRKVITTNTLAQLSAKFMSQVLTSEGVPGTHSVG